jgi:8-oxo-dGTP diphosphatase
MTYKRAAVIIIKDNRILLMKRKKDKEIYYTIPGGTLDKGESLEKTAVREIKEETNLDIVLGELLWNIKDGISECSYFLCRSFSGTLKLGGPEVKRNSFYCLKWVLIEKIKKINLKPELIIEKIKDLKTMSAA